MTWKSISACFLSILFVLLAGLSVPETVADEQNENAGSDGRPLYLEIPFDRLTLTPHYDSETFDVFAIDFPEKRRPDPFPKTGKLTVRFLNDPGKEFEVAWEHVAKIELFCELVRQEYLSRFHALLDDVRKLSPDGAGWTSLAGRFEALFDYLRFLDQDDYRPILPDVGTLLFDFLREEAAYRVKSGDFVTALSRFERAYATAVKERIASQDPERYRLLQQSWSDTLNLAVEKESGEKHFVRCRQYLRQFQSCYGDHQTVLDWQAKFLARSKELLEQAKQALQAKELIRSYRLCEEAIEISPDWEELVLWRRTLRRDVPGFRVAVAAPMPRGELLRQDTIPDDNLMRARRLFCMMLVDYMRPGLEGGVYRSVAGTMERIDANRELVWSLSDPSIVSAHDLAETLSKGRDASPRGVHEFIDSIRIESADRFRVRFHRSPLIPESLFVMPLVDSKRADLEGLRWESPDREGVPDTTASDDLMPGPFVREMSENADGGSLACSADELARPIVLFERAGLSVEEAGGLLRTGKIDVIERIPPWSTESFQRDGRFVVGRYAVPSIHFLVPNWYKPLPANRTFRRALLYGLNRSEMFARLGGKGNVVSVPFVRGASMSDPLGYAYDTSINPRPYEPKLAMALSMLAMNQIRERLPDGKETTSMPELVLARPDHETEEYIALMIRRQWTALGIATRIVVYRDSDSVGQDPAVDFWLLRRTVKEPLADADRLFGSGGLAGKTTPYMEQALEKLRNAEDWPAAAKCLFEIHRLCYEETTVLPLWQMTEYYVHRTEIKGILDDDRTEITDLYRNLLQWHWEGSAVQAY